MSINRQDSRHRIKRSNLTGVTPTAHTASTDFTDGTWLNTDIREGEFFYNIPDVRLWVGTGTSSREIEFVGGTAGGESLTDTLFVGNTMSGNITSPSGNDILTINDGLILLTSPTEVSNNCTDGSIYQTGVYSSSTLIPSTEMIAQYLGGTSSRVVVRADSSILQESTNTAGDYTQIILDVNTGIVIETLNTSSLSNSQSIIDMNPSYTNITLTDNINNVVDIITIDNNGVGIKSTDTTTSLYSESVTTPTSISLYADAGNSGTGLSLGPNFIGIGFDAITDPSADLTTIQISDGGRTISFNSNPTTNNPEVNISGNSILIDGGTFVNIETTELITNLSNVLRTEIGATISTSSVGTQSISSITSMVNNQMISIDGRISGYCSSPNRAYSVKFYAVFEKYGGTIYQVGTTDLTVKDNYGDGTTVDISTDGTDILINVVPNNTLSINWNTIYDYIITP
jgi:hypothetical protein